MEVRTVILSADFSYWGLPTLGGQTHVISRSFWHFSPQNRAAPEMPGTSSDDLQLDDSMTIKVNWWLSNSENRLKGRLAGNHYSLWENLWFHLDLPSNQPMVLPSQNPWWLISIYPAKINNCSHIHIHIYICIHTHVYICIHIYTYVYKYTFKYYIYTHIHMSTHNYIYVYIYI